MGEVYRADDMKLGQPVALKFLPVDVEREEDRVVRFLNEVRMALKVSHPNVTRVHDIGEVDGHHYISMEYVDGEDLASLLRRIGRLPKDKAVQVARQLCAGIAAAHDQGVLHRDLKPANVMIDGRGQVKITDFGLAGLDKTIQGEECRAGTPAYMAPEQWEGREVSAKSDLYSLGLVLYELFTGRPVYKGKNPSEIIKLHKESSPTTPSSLIEGFDPAVERLILKCLEKDPTNRPPSAMAISAALPGGDPLADALAAGETPSPELVAQAGGVGGLRPLVAWACVVAVVLGGVSGVWLAGHEQLLRLAPLDRSPAYLAEKALEILASLGHDEPPADSLFYFGPNDAYLDLLVTQGLTARGRERLRTAQPSAMTFRYRQSPKLLVRQQAAGIGNWDEDPPDNAPGMRQVELDPQGRLRMLKVIPWEAAVEPSGASGSAADVDWEPAFEAAGLALVDFEAVKPRWNPPVFADDRRAWTGVYPDASNVEIRLEAASLDGVPVWFRILEPWSEPAVAGASRDDSPPVLNLWLMVVLVAGGTLAWRNLRLGRGDQRGALRFAVYFGLVRMLWLLAADHLPSLEEIDLLISHLAFAAYRVCLVWILYMALEPFARKIWPSLLTAWVRLLNGRFRDPLVGRDVLVGVVLGTSMTAVFAFKNLIAIALDLEVGEPLYSLWSAVALRGGRYMLGALAGTHSVMIFELFMVAIMILTLRLILRKMWLVVPIFALISSVVFFNPGENLWLFWASHLVFVVLFWTVFSRFGLLAVLVGMTVGALLVQMPLTFDLSAPYSGSTWMTVLAIAALTGWGFRVALAGRPMFGDETLGESS